nr:hypothetical protein [Mycobacterium sp. UM_NZ2]
MAEPANLNSIHAIDTDTLARGTEALLASETVAGPIDPVVELVADMVSTAVTAAATAQQQTPDATPAEIWQAAYAALTQEETQ